MNWYLDVLRKYVDFGGRARRKEYWMFVLFNVIISVVLVMVDLALGTFSAERGMGLLGGIYSLGVLLPSLSVCVRRLHDTDRSGWWLLIAFVPCVGAFVLLYFLVDEGTRGSNHFGPDPKAGVA
jgi:uncharacterized membrane protein YhaH (DUF805 family)